MAHTDLSSRDAKEVPLDNGGWRTQIFLHVTLAKYIIRALMVENRCGGCRTLRF